MLCILYYTILYYTMLYYNMYTRCRGARRDALHRRRGPRLAPPSISSSMIMCVYIYIYTYIHTHMRVCVYIYRERERERERERCIYVLLWLLQRGVLSGVHKGGSRPKGFRPPFTKCAWQHVVVRRYELYSVLVASIVESILR